MSARPPLPDRPLRIGTRGSPLALAQAHEARDRLMAAHGLPEAAFAIVVDPHHRRPGAGPAAVGARRQGPVHPRDRGGARHRADRHRRPLDEGHADAAARPASRISCLPAARGRARRLGERGGQRAGGAAGRSGGRHLEPAPAGPAAATGGPTSRSSSSAAASRPGSASSREGVAAATFLAMAGLRRLGHRRAGTPIAPDEMLPAVAQGAIGIEQRAGDDARRGAARRDPRRRDRPAARSGARLSRRPRRLLPDADRRARRALRRAAAPPRRDHPSRRLGSA